MEDERRVVLGVRIKPAAKERLKVLAAENGVDMSTMARWVFAAGMQTWEKAHGEG